MVADIWDTTRTDNSQLSCTVAALHTSGRIATQMTNKNTKIKMTITTKMTTTMTNTIIIAKQMTIKITETNTMTTWMTPLVVSHTAVKAEKSEV